MKMGGSGRFEVEEAADGKITLVAAERKRIID